MDNFVNRLEYILEKFDYTASGFADKIGVQRSSLSHLLSGRNKPSLDFILKINTTFPELNLDWLIKGEGDFSTPTLLNSIHDNEEQITLAQEPVVKNTSESNKGNQATIEQNSNVVQGAFTPYKKTPVSSEKPNSNYLDLAFSSDVDYIVIFHKDGTFSKFKPRE